MIPSLPSPEKIEKLNILTRRYSNFIKHGAGVSYVIVALFFIIAYYATEALYFDIFGKILFCLPMLMFWVLIRNIIRSRMYQTLGIVTPSKQKQKPIRDPKLKKKLITFGVIWVALFIVIPFLVFVRLETITIEQVLRFIAITSVSSLAGFYLAKSKLDMSLVIPTLGFAAIALNDLEASFQYHNRQDSLAYTLFVVSAFVAFIGIFEHVRYQRVTKEIIELQRSL